MREDTVGSRRDQTIRAGRASAFGLGFVFGLMISVSGISMRWYTYRRQGMACLSQSGMQILDVLADVRDETPEPTSSTGTYLSQGSAISLPVP